MFTPHYRLLISTAFVALKTDSEEADCKENVKFEFLTSLNLDVAVTETITSH